VQPRRFNLDQYVKPMKNGVVYYKTITPAKNTTLGQPACNHDFLLFEMKSVFTYQCLLTIVRILHRIACLGQISYFSVKNLKKSSPAQSNIDLMPLF